MYVCLCTRDTQCVQRPEEGDSKYPYSHSVVAKNQTLVLFRSKLFLTPFMFI